MLFFEPKNSFNPFGLLLRGDFGLQKKQFVNLPQNVCFMKKFFGGTAYLEAYATVAGGLAGGSIGEETGFGSMHGRGWYSGFDVAGLYAGSSVNGGFSWGFQESLLFGVRSNIPGKIAADGSSRSVMSWGVHIPSLGQFGYFESDFDFSSDGIKRANDEALLDAFKGDERLTEMVNKQLNRDKYTLEDFMEFKKGLMNLGFNELRNPGDHGDGTIKYTYKKGTVLWGWGQIEFCVGPKDAYASFNYGNHWWTHALLDGWGYLNRGY